MVNQENIIPNSMSNSIDFKSNSSKSKPVATVDSDMKIDQILDQQTQLREQIDFYLSDANMFNDQFMRKTLLKTPEQKIEIDILLQFNHIR